MTFCSNLDMRIIACTRKSSFPTWSFSISMHFSRSSSVITGFIAVSQYIMIFATGVLSWWERSEMISCTSCSLASLFRAAAAVISSNRFNFICTFDSSVSLSMSKASLDFPFSTASMLLHVSSAKDIYFLRICSQIPADAAPRSTKNKITDVIIKNTVLSSIFILLSTDIRFRKSSLYMCIPCRRSLNAVC